MYRCCTDEFQSTPSAWRETSPGRIDRQHDDISIHSLRMEGDEKFGEKIGECIDISIHSLRMEGDCVFVVIYKLMLYFNPLPPHGGRRGKKYRVFVERKFQSTPSAWRETDRRFSSVFLDGISIHSLRMEGDAKHRATGTGKQAISIHSLRMEGDQSHKPQVQIISIISIHSLRMEGDDTDFR